MQTNNKSISKKWNISVGMGNTNTIKRMQIRNEGWQLDQP